MNNIKFGTDGIRGRAGEFPLDKRSIEAIALAMLSLLSTYPRVSIARDTRESGIWIAKTIQETLVNSGVTVTDCGILPTAALACVVVDDQQDLGVVITASHNPWMDNGIKLFNSNGKKLSDEQQHTLQEAIGAPLLSSTKGSLHIHPTPTEAWRSRLPNVNLSGWTILLDCAHGALSPYGEEILLNLGATVHSIASSPTGQNINEAVGAVHPPTDIHGFDIALSFDGDADRIIMVCPKIGVIDGDDFLWLLRNEIDGPLIGTVMSNGGLDSALNGRLHRSSVGDRNVVKLMEELGATLGAETSGHVIFKGDMPSGDGLYAALRILEAIGAPPIEVQWTRWPTAQQNIRFTSNKIDLDTLESLTAAKAAGQRLVVRYSGTESKLRILVEGDNAQKWCQEIAQEFTAKLRD